MTDKRQKMSLILLGSKGCGKSSLVHRWTTPGKIPHPDETLAIDVMSHTVVVKNIHYIIRFWDTAGDDFYDTLLERYVYNSDCCVIVFDVTKTDSWDRAKYWVEKAMKSNNNSIPICLISNKVDLESSRKIHKKDVQKYVNSIHNKRMVHSETSTITGENVKSTYHLIVNFCKKPVREVWSSEHYSDNGSKCLIV